MAANCLPSLLVGVGLDDVNDGESHKDSVSAAVQEEEEEGSEEDNPGAETHDEEPVAVEDPDQEGENEHHSADEDEAELPVVATPDGSSEKCEQEPIGTEGLSYIPTPLKVRKASDSHLEGPATKKASKVMIIVL